jgi:multiple sugar transport system substrate-binding protein
VTVRKIGLLVSAVALLVPALAGCGSDDEGGAGEDTTLTYWASNQGTSLEHDKQVLQPELDKFTQQTGVKVKLEVVPWSDLLNRILAATTSGKGPDVLNIGNTWSASLQATGALLPFDAATLDKVGGRDRFMPASIAATGAEGKDPTAVPLYSLAYALYYNKKQFAAAGIASPPATWDELVAAGRKLTGGGRWGLVLEGGNISENAHHAFTFGQQYGGELFDASGKPQFDSPAVVTAVKRYVDLMAKDKIVNPSNAEYATNKSVTDFANGKAAMMLWQAAGSALKAQDMNPDDYGVAPVPLPRPTPPGGKPVTSMVAGINLAVFKNTQHKDAALEFVKFMVSDDEQKTLNKTYGSLPSVKGAYSDTAFQSPEAKVLQQALATSAAPLPQVAEESQFETLVGTAMKDMFADAASGKAITDEYVRSKLARAQQQMRPGG